MAYVFPKPPKDGVARAKEISRLSKEKHLAAINQPNKVYTYSGEPAPVYDETIREQPRSHLMNRWLWNSRYKFLAGNQILFDAHDFGLEDIDVNNLKWNSSKTSVATVEGVAGTATATATMNYTFTGLHDECELRCTVKDSYGQTAQAGSTFAVVSADTTPAVFSSATVVLSDTTATVGEDVGTINCSLSNVTEPDDGSYTYSWSFGGPTNGTLKITGNGATATITGIPATATSLPVRCSVKNSTHTGSATAASLVISAEVTGNVIGSVGAVTGVGTNPGHPKKGTAYVGREFTATPSPADDGTYTWYWYWNNQKNTGTDDSATVTPTGMTLTNTDTDTVTWGGTPTTSGTFYLWVDVTDVYGTTKTTTGAGGLVVDN